MNGRPEGTTVEHWYPSVRAADPVREQADRGPKRVFVLGVQARAVHARWCDWRKADRQGCGGGLPPCVFWCGDGWKRFSRESHVPPQAGYREPPAGNLDGPSRKSIDEHSLRPFELTWAEETCNDHRAACAIARKSVQAVPEADRFGQQEENPNESVTLCPIMPLWGHRQGSRADFPCQVPRLRPVPHPARRAEIGIEPAALIGGGVESKPVGALYGSGHAYSTAAPHSRDRQRVVHATARRALRFASGGCAVSSGCGSASSVTPPRWAGSQAGRVVRNRSGVCG